MILVFSLKYKYNVSFKIQTFVQRHAKPSVWTVQENFQAEEISTRMVTVISGAPKPATQTLTHITVKLDTAASREQSKVIPLTVEDVTVSCLIID